MKQPICIMAGGTGGHIFPGLAVAEELIKRGETVCWIGSNISRGTTGPRKTIPFITSWFADFAENMDFSELQVQYDLAFR